jgi:hypothetical protein
MYGSIHYFRTFYAPEPAPGSRFRQIVVVKAEMFQVRTLDGDVLRTEAEFQASNDLGEIILCRDISEALSEAEGESQRAMSEGFEIYTPV